MTDAERAALERKISEMREPRPLYRNVDVDVRTEQVWSEDGNWYLIYVHDYGDEVEKHPRPWTSDESANAVLREELPRAQMTHRPQENMWIVAPDWLDPYVSGESPEFTIAVALAWIAMKEKN